MPDSTYKTFLSPGSCQLEITDLVASANDDTGVDLYGVAWEIEQVLIAGEGFAASPTDVWVNERGILNIGQSLFDKINRTAEDNDNIPGQCTVVVKATSLYDSSKIARLKVLVGYPGEGGGGGSGGETVTVFIFGMVPDISGDTPVEFSISIEEFFSGDEVITTEATREIGEDTIHGFEFTANVGEVYLCEPEEITISSTSAMKGTDYGNSFSIGSEISSFIVVAPNFDASVVFYKSDDSST